MKNLYRLRYGLVLVFLTSESALCAMRGRPVLNSARTTFVADNGRLLRGPYTSSEWGNPAPTNEIANIKNLGFNTIHLYGETFDINYPKAGSTAPGYSAARIDRMVKDTRDQGLYLVITIGNGANNGNYNFQYSIDFWKFYAPRYANETHVIFEIHNEPVAWGPPYSSATATPIGAVNMEVACYNTIRQFAPSTPVLLFSYSVMSGKGASDNAIKDIQAFNQTVFGNPTAVWTNMAVGFHGYAGARDTEIAVDNLIKAGHPMFMTEYGGYVWGDNRGGFDIELTAALERLGVSWNAFAYIAPSGVSDNVSAPNVYTDRIINSGLSWIPDYGTFPANRSIFGNGGLIRKTPDYVNNKLNGTLRIQAEDFDNGGKSVAYFNANTSNAGGQYRTTETVGIETTSDVNGGYNIGWVAKDDWLEYTIQAPVAGVYDLRLRVAGLNPGQLKITARGKEDLTGVWDLPNTGGVQIWTTVTKSVLLGSGLQKLRITALTQGFNLNWIELSPTIIGPLTDGIYRMKNVATGQALDVNTSNTLITAAASNSASQTWKLQHLGGNEYRIALPKNDWTWDTWFGPLHLTGYWGAGGDRSFIILPASGGKFRVIQSGGGDYMEPTTKNPATLNFGPWANANTQLWEITSTTVTGIEQSENITQTEIYPNPFENSSLVNTSGLFQYEILNIQGVTVETGSGFDSKNIGSALSKGAYLVRIIQGGKQEVKSLIKL
ncbi:MAG: carbohydrate-binding protein [Opitutaceae bacterium]|nr:carbohydrate-binding protein [Cytophagales bacterium]